MTFEILGLSKREYKYYRVQRCQKANLLSERDPHSTKLINMHKASATRWPAIWAPGHRSIRRCSLRAVHYRNYHLPHHCTTLWDYLNKGTNVSVNLDRLIFLFSPYNTYRLCPSVINNNISQLKKQKKYERTFKDPRICLTLSFHRKATCH